MLIYQTRKVEDTIFLALIFKKICFASKCTPHSEFPSISWSFQQTMFVSSTFNKTAQLLHQNMEQSFLVQYHLLSRTHCQIQVTNENHAVFYPRFLNPWETFICFQKCDLKHLHMTSATPFGKSATKPLNTCTVHFMWTWTSPPMPSTLQQP